jgi:acetyl esterase/lipase
MELYRPQIADFSLEGISQLAAVEYGKPNGYPLRMDLIFDVNAKKPMPAIIWVHGGGCTEENYTRLSRPEKCFVELAKRGFLIASVDYRLAQVEPFPAQVRDCKCAVRFLRSHAAQYGIDPNHIGVWGESCGGQIVGLMAVENGISGYEDVGGWEGISSAVQAAVAWYGGFDILRFTNMLHDERFLTIYGGTPEEKRDVVIKGSPITYAAAKVCPVLSMCSNTDVRVPYQQSVDYCKALNAHGNDATHITIPDQGHGYFEGDEYAEAVYQFFAKHLMV